MLGDLIVVEDSSQKGGQGGIQNEIFGGQNGDHLSPFLFV